MRTAAVQPIQTFKRYTISSQTSSFAGYILFRNLISLHQQSTNDKPSTPFASKKVDLRQGSLKCPHPSPFMQKEAAAQLQKLHIFRHDNQLRPFHRKATIETAISVWSAGFVQTNCGHSSLSLGHVSSVARDT